MSLTAIKACAAQDGSDEVLVELLEKICAMLDVLLDLDLDLDQLTTLTECLAELKESIELLCEKQESLIETTETISEVIESVSETLESILECCSNSETLLEALLECCADNTAILETLVECCEEQTEVLNEILEKVCELLETNITLGMPCCIQVAGVWVLAQASLDGRWFMTAAGGLVEVVPEGLDPTGLSCLLDLSDNELFSCSDDGNRAIAPSLSDSEIARLESIETALQAVETTPEPEPETVAAVDKATQLIQARAASLTKVKDRLLEIKAAKADKEV